MKRVRLLLPALAVCGLVMLCHPRILETRSDLYAATDSIGDSDRIVTDSPVIVDSVKYPDTIDTDTIAPIDTIPIVPDIPTDTVVPPDTVPDIPVRTVFPITDESLVISDSVVFDAGDSCIFKVSLPDDISGVLTVRDSSLHARLIRKNNFTDENIALHGDFKLEEAPDTDITDVMTQDPDEPDSDTIHEVELLPVMSDNGCGFMPLDSVPDGDWLLDIPEGYFEIKPEFAEVDEFDSEDENFLNLNVCGAWHFAGNSWENGKGMFTLIDDDCLDGYIPSSVPGKYTYGYYSLLYPILESLGLRGCISMEGRRVGFNVLPKPVLNDNGKVALRLQNEKGWEIMSHSMNCIGEVLNNWVVDSLSSPLADEILKKFPFERVNQNQTSVYDRSTGKQYFPLSDNSGWQESPAAYIKPYAGDYITRKPMLYNPDFDIDYHWGRFFRLARDNGFNVNCYVCYNSTSSHALIPEINKVCPYGFADSPDTLYNVPPLKSSIARLGLEGQVLKGYIGEKDTDNTFNQEHFDFFKQKIDECMERGGWIVLYTHAYRNCWKNYIEGSLVSEGGHYPDEWVNPMEGTDPLIDSLDPPARLGINDWSEWFPCPGTRSYMIWKLLKYARDSGMVNVTGSEALKKFCNRQTAGYFSYGEKIGENVYDIEGTSDYYPHFVQGANDEVYYYKPYISGHIVHPINVSNMGDAMIDEISSESIVSPQENMIAVSITGLRVIISSLRDLSSGLWIVNGKKIFIRP